MKSIRSATALQRLVLLILLPAFALLDSPLQANPSGGVVVHGAADIAQAAANHLKIHQHSQTAIINWQDFSIGAGEITQFVQPGGGTALNRVVGGNVSQIHGALQANANVYVINPNGIFIGAQGVVDIGGHAVLSTLDISNQDFLSGSRRFQGDSRTGITNFGSIESAGGDVILLGGFVDNHGQIGALNGTVAIGSGGDIELMQTSSGRISIRGGSDYEGVGINNEGVVQGTAVEMKAHGNVYALAINNTGMVRASGATRENGRVRLRASGGSSNINLGQTSQITAETAVGGGSIRVESTEGSVNVDGVVSASSSLAGGSVEIVGRDVVQQEGSNVGASGATGGGNVTLAADESLSVGGGVDVSSSAAGGGSADLMGRTVEVGSQASVSASGDTTGGSIRVGGDFQGRPVEGLRIADTVSVERGASFEADAAFGDAGSVIVWAQEDTTFFGDVSASARGAIGNGGFIEISGKTNLEFDGLVVASSVGGHSGTVLFDPGDVTVGGAGSTVTIASINASLQAGTNVLIFTDSGNIIFESVGGGGDQNGTTQANNRDSAIQWTNSTASFGAIASGSIIVQNHIRTSGEGSISLLAGWTGAETDVALSFDPQSAWDFYVSQGMFGENGGSVIVGSPTMTRHVEVGSRFGDTNVAGFDVRVRASSTNSNERYAMIGFKDGGQVFAPRLDRGGGVVLDMIRDSDNSWYLSDGLVNLADAGLVATGASTNLAGQFDPVVAIAGQNEVDITGDGIADGVHGVNSEGVLTDTFIPYASHYNSATSGNWWWQRIDAANPDPLGSGGLRPEHGAGTDTNGANINVIARGNVVLEGGSGRDQGAAMIGHGGPNNNSWGGAGLATRDVGGTNHDAANFSHSGIERGQMERRWSFNGARAGLNGTAIGRLAPVYGNINVFAGVDPNAPVFVNRAAGTVNATVGTGGNVILRGSQDWKTSNMQHNAFVQIGHGGVGQMGEFYGDIHVEAGGSVILQAGTATRSHATIGHTVNALVDWNLVSNVDQQLRFFATASDFDNPNLRRGELFSGRVTTGFDPDLDPHAPDRIDDPLYWRGRDREVSSLGDEYGGYQRGFAPLTLAPVGLETVEALDGNVITGMYGNITVIARTGEVRLEAGSSPDDVSQLTNSDNMHREGRFAQIGHGGGSSAQDDQNMGSGYRIGSLSGAANTSREDVRFYITTDSSGNAETSSGGLSQVSSGGSGLNRNQTHMNIAGDIMVSAGGNIDLLAGNDVHDFSQIGHGGANLADYETSSFILGDIQVSAGGDMTLRGGGFLFNEGRRGNFDMRAWAQIGHGGYRTGFFMFNGDIDVSVGRHLTMTGGAYAATYAQIGHQGFESWGQTGGNFSRSEHFLYDLNEAEVDTVLDAGQARVDYTFTDLDGNVTTHSRSFATAGTLLGDRNTADINVEVGGDIRMNHLADGHRRNWRSEQRGEISNPAGADQGVRTRRSHVQIGHGGVSTRAFRENNPLGNYGNKIGDIRVIAGGDIVMENAGAPTEVPNPFPPGTGLSVTYGDGATITVRGGGEDRWTRIGHGVGGATDRVSGTSTLFPNSTDLAGNITVQAGGDIILDANAADANENPRNFSALAGAAPVSRRNPVAIGHGATVDALDVVVLGNGELVNGIEARSTISVSAGRDLMLFGGKGFEGSSAQIGHGWSSDVGNDPARRFNVPTGFTGDIFVNVGRHLTLEAGHLAWIETPAGIAGIGASVSGAFAAIGNGGYQMDRAPAHGDITVYVGGDLRIVAQQRVQVGTNTSALYTFVNQEGATAVDHVAGVFNFAKIGHVNAENGNRHVDSNGNPTTTDAVRSSDQSGNIFVVVGNDLELVGGTTPDMNLQPIYGAFAQIGHGGPSIGGDTGGDVTVLVGNDLTATGGTTNLGSEITRNPNNYVMIGNGDWIFGAEGSAGALFRTGAGGIRSGDINVAAGRHATFDRTLVGHADPLVSNRIVIGDTRVAVSRLNPFFGGGGRLTAVNGSVFTSGFSGSGSRLEFYMPARSNNLVDDTTRLNETTATFVESPGNFAAPFDREEEEHAGREDEVYLTPDLWWDNLGRAAAANIPGGAGFPTDAISGMGGAIADVNSPGGLFNLVGLNIGVLGDSGASLYRGSNGVSGAGQYTFFFDAIQFVSNTLPVPPTPPGPLPPPPFVFVFDFSGESFRSQYEAFLLSQGMLNDEIAGGMFGLHSILGLYELDEDSIENTGPWNLETRLDRAFGERRSSFSPEERAEEQDRLRRRARRGNPVPNTFYVYSPTTNQYSSFNVFGLQSTNFLLTN